MMQTFSQLVQSLQTAESQKDVIQVFYNLDSILKAQYIKLPQYQGDIIVDKLIASLNALGAHLTPDEFTVCKSLFVHTLQHREFVTIRAAQDLYRHALERLLICEPSDWRFSMYISILIDFFLKIAIHQFDPRKDQRDAFTCSDGTQTRLGDLFQCCRRAFRRRPFDKLHEQVLLLISAVSYECPQIICRYFSYYFGPDSIVSEGMLQVSRHTLLKESIKALLQACKASKKQLKVATLASERQSFYLTQHQWADALVHSLDMLKGIYYGYDKLEQPLQKLLNTCFANFLEGINYHNLGIQFKRLIQGIVHRVEDQLTGNYLQLKLQIIIFNQLKQDIYDMITFNRFRFGSYYNQLLSDFQPDFVYSVKLLNEYFRFKRAESASWAEKQRNNKFAVLDSDYPPLFSSEQLQDGYLVDLNFQFVSAYLAVNPVIIEVAQLFCEFHDNLKCYMLLDADNGQTQESDSEVQQQDGKWKNQPNNIIHLLLHNILAFSATHINQLSGMTQQLQHGCNIITNTLNSAKNSEMQQQKPSNNLLFVEYYINSLMGKDMKPISESFIFTTINLLYQQFIIESTKIQTASCTTLQSYYVVIYHTPIQLLNTLLDSSSFLAIYNHVTEQIQQYQTKRLNDLHEQNYFSKILYAFQLLLKTEFAWQDQLILDGGISILYRLLSKYSIAPNNKKPVLQTIGSMIIQQDHFDSNLVSVVTKECKRSGRAQATAIRVLQFIIRKLDQQLRVDDATRLEDLVELLTNCIDEHKEATSFAALVVIGDMYEYLGKIYNAIVDEQQRITYVRRCASINSQVLDSSADKAMEIRGLYPRTQDNVFRSYQVRKYLVQSVRLLSSIPPFLVDQIVFNRVKYEYAEFARLFSNEPAAMRQVVQTALWLVAAQGRLGGDCRVDAVARAQAAAYLEDQAEELRLQAERLRQGMRYMDPSEREGAEGRIVQLEELLRAVVERQKQTAD